MIDTSQKVRDHVEADCCHRLGTRPRPSAGRPVAGVETVERSRDALPGGRPSESRCPLPQLPRRRGLEGHGPRPGLGAAGVPRGRRVLVAGQPSRWRRLRGDGTQQVVRQPGRGQVVAGAEGASKIPSRPAWSFPPCPWTSHVRAIAPSPHDARLLLAGIELGGVMRARTGSRPGAITGRARRRTSTPSPDTRPSRAARTRRAAVGPPGAATAGSLGNRPTRAATATTPGASPSRQPTPTAGTSPRTPAPGWHTTASSARRRTSTAGAGAVRGSRSAADCPNPWTASPLRWRPLITPSSPGWGTGGFIGARTGATTGTSWMSAPTPRPAYWDWS
jgi:hypothetical protein